MHWLLFSLFFFACVFDVNRLLNEDTKKNIEKMLNKLIKFNWFIFFIITEIEEKKNIKIDFKLLHKNQHWNVPNYIVSEKNLYIFYWKLFIGITTNIYKKKLIFQLVAQCQIPFIFFSSSSYFCVLRWKMRNEAGAH